MPTYDYRCPSCEYEFSTEKRMSDPNPETCPECNEDGLKQIISGGGGFVLKGLNWPGKSFSSEMSKIIKDQKARDDKRDMVEYEAMWKEKEKKAFDKFQAPTTDD